MVIAAIHTNLPAINAFVVRPKAHAGATGA